MIRKGALISCLLLVLSWPAAWSQQPLPAGLSENTVDLGEIEMYYRTAGDGPPLLLLHGFLDTVELWDPWVTTLSERHTVIIPDLRGHGRSTNPGGTFTFAQSAEDVWALVDMLGLERFDAVGYSAGGLTLMHMAIEDRERIGKLVLLGCGPYLADSARAKLEDFAVWDEMPSWLQSSLLSLHPDGEEQVLSLIRQFRGFAADYSDPNFTPPQIAKIDAETLVIAGETDVFFPLDVVLHLYTNLPNASLWVIPARGHELIFYDATPGLQDEFLRVLTGHLGEP